MPASQQARVYLDYAATAPFDERLCGVIEAAPWANANALYEEGRMSARCLNDARARIAGVLGAHAPAEIIFTSGGSESDNTAIKGLANIVPGAARTHVVVSAIEHPAVLNAADALKRRGFKVDSLVPDAKGVVGADALEELLAAIDAAGDATTLVCVQAVNNEIGTIQPVRALAQTAHAHHALFVCDAVQALGKIPIDLEASGVDACSFSAHKIGAPHGCGILYLRRGLHLVALVHGGGQEHGLRSGTSNVPGALAFARAVELAEEERAANAEHAAALRARLLAGIARGAFPHRLECTLPQDAPHVAHILSLLCDGLEGETLVLRCDNAGIAVSSGSACSTGSLDPSHVLSAIGIPKERAYCSLRLSFGRQTTQGDIDRFIDALPEVLR